MFSETDKCNSSLLKLKSIKYFFMSSSLIVSLTLVFAIWMFEKFLKKSKFDFNLSYVVKVSFLFSDFLERVISISPSKIFKDELKKFFSKVRSSVIKIFGK